MTNATIEVDFRDGFGQKWKTNSSEEENVSSGMGPEVFAW